MTRNGKKAVKYKESLPELLQAASDGDLKRIRNLLESNGAAIVVEQKDRHKSLAEHWAVTFCFLFVVNIGF